MERLEVMREVGFGWLSGGKNVELGKKAEEGIGADRDSCLLWFL